MTYTIDGKVAVVQYDSAGRVVSVTFPDIPADTAGNPTVYSFAPGIAVSNIEAWLGALIILAGL